VAIDLGRVDVAARRLDQRVDLRARVVVRGDHELDAPRADHLAVVGGMAVDRQLRLVVVVGCRRGRGRGLCCHHDRVRRGMVGFALGTRGEGDREDGGA
jgi:hypothetical protein